MKIALPSNEGQVDGHFGHCQYFTIFSIDDDNNIVGEQNLVPSAGCGCKSNLASDLAEMGVKVMLAGGIGGGAVNVLAANGIEVVRGCSGDVKDAAKAWLAGRIEDSGQVCEAHDGCGRHHRDGCDNP